MMRALYSGVAGLKTHQTKMDVIGNNIANVNTVGFKSSAVTFSDLLYQNTQGASGPGANIGGINAKQVGLGSKTASTNISITTGGANQTTGGAFDLKLSDGSTTNFFIVNNGTENFFTRAGSFTVDAAGNLVMGSNGYYVMGWQVDPTTHEIKKDTVSKLQIMNADARTSAPEATTESYISGVLDKNDTDVNSDDGYAMNLNFYDSLGYSYTAKFAVKVTDADKGEYTIELKNIYDSKSKDILEEYLAEDPTHSVADLFGTPGTKTTKYSPVVTDGFSVSGTDLTYTKDGSVYYARIGGTPITDPGGSGALGYNFTTQTTPTQTVFKSIAQIYGVSETIAQSIAATTGTTGTIDDTGTFVVSEPSVFNTMKFDLENANGKGNGALWWVGNATDTGNTGLTNLTLNTSVLTAYGAANERGVFSDINVDCSSVLSYDNKGTSSMGMTRGAQDGINGLGKALGALTGLSIDASGCIYGTYDNGNTTLLGQIPVAQFANASGLEAVGQSLFKATLNSGDFDGIGVDVTADGGSMVTGALEMSNVDLSTEFTDMITTQRGFQANSRIITTSDTLLEELINLKR
ncbi:MAG: flagellar hook-basal body complex protein [Lachnospiraceae bacterium]|nr:flagellar hook-basal body complex protein [Lachnospiraceae bacterium]